MRRTASTETDPQGQRAPCHQENRRCREEYTDTSDSEEEDFSEDAQGLTLSHHGELLEWRMCDEDMVKDQREELGYKTEETAVNILLDIAQESSSAEVDVWKLLLPWDFLVGLDDPSCLVWTNENLPHDVAPFSRQEWMRFLGVLYYQALAPWSSYGSLWAGRDVGVLPPHDLGRRFAVSRVRFEQWKCYLRLWPQEAEHALSRAAQIRPLLDAFNRRRLETIIAGSELSTDETKGRWRAREEVRVCGSSPAFLSSFPHLSTGEEL